MKLTKLLVGLFLAAFMVYADYEAEAEEVAESAEVAEVAEAKEVGSEQTIFDRLPFAGGIFLCPAMEEVNRIYPQSDNAVRVSVQIGFNANFQSAWELNRALYQAAEKALIDGTAEDEDFEIFLMAMSYENLTNIAEHFFVKRAKRLEAERDESVDHHVLLTILKERGHEPLVERMTAKKGVIIPLDNRKAKAKAGASWKGQSGSPNAAGIAMQRRIIARMWEKMTADSKK